MNKRHFLGVSAKTLAFSAAALWGGSVYECLAQTKSAGAAEQKTEIEKWMEDWMETRSLVGPLVLSRFVEPMYFLVQPIGWKPSEGQPGYAPVTVPIGFVTDLASIPRIFWSLFRPDGEYAYAAIVHDYLYWYQKTPRKVADDIFKLAMQDLEVSPRDVDALYSAVRLGGESAWRDNAALKARGEKRLLKRFPSDPTTRWKDWKVKPDVFQ